MPSNQLLCVHDRVFQNRELDAATVTSEGHKDVPDEVLREARRVIHDVERGRVHYVSDPDGVGTEPLEAVREIAAGRRQNDERSKGTSTVRMPV